MEDMVLEEKWRIWSEISKFIEDSTSELFCTSDDLHEIVFGTIKTKSFTDLNKILLEKEMFFRIENDEELIYLSIIDRKVYPRIWSDNFKENNNLIVSESKEHLIERSVSGSEKDWLVRFSDEKIENCIEQAIDYLTK